MEVSVKKLLKFFSLIFILFITIANCSAITDCRFIKDSKLKEFIKTPILALNLKTAYGSDEILNVDYGSMVFARDCENINQLMLFVPILASSKGIVGEVQVQVEIKNGEIFDLTSHYDLEIQIIDINVTFSTCINKLKYMHDWLLIPKLKSIVTVKTDDRVFYILSPNCTDVYVVYESSKKGKTTSKGFVFQESGKLKPVSLKSDVSKVNFFKSLVNSIFCSSPESQGYTSLLTTGDSDHKKTE